MSPVRSVTRAWMLALVLGASAPQSWAIAPDGPTTTSAPAELAPPPATLELLGDPDPEKQIAGFARWHAWRSALDRDRRRLANAYLATPRWLTVLGNETLYDIDSRKRRVTAFKLLAKIGGQRVFPYFVWGIDLMADNSSPWSLLTRRTVPEQYVRYFLKKHGDPTVIEYLPDWRWYDVHTSINDRWADKTHPDQEWEPIEPDDRIADLAHRDPARRRLAARALALNRRVDKQTLCGPFRALLSDRDSSVVSVTVLALRIVSCPGTRGRLKSLVADDTRPVAFRRGALFALANCRTAHEWTAEWMIDSLPDWPAELDATVSTCLGELGKSYPRNREKFLSYLRRARDATEDSRVRAVVDRAIEKQ